MNIVIVGNMQDFPTDLALEMIKGLRKRFMNVYSLGQDMVWAGNILTALPQDTKPDVFITTEFISSDGLNYENVLVVTESHPGKDIIITRMKSWWEVFDHLARKQTRDRQVVRFR